MDVQHSKKKQEKTKTYFWTILKWYWFIVPAFYYILILPRLVLNDAGPMVSGEDIFTILFQFLNFILSGLMFVTNPLERSKTGVADNFLKIAVTQQFIVQNIFGMILALLTWYNLPYRVKPEDVSPEDTKKWYFKPKTILILSGVSLAIAIFSMIGNLS